MITPPILDQKKLTSSENLVESLADYKEFTETLPLEDFRPKMYSKLFWFAAILFSSLFILFATVPIPLEEKFEFSIKSDQKDVVYRFPNVVYVNDCFVKVGQNVKKGTPLVKITSPEIANLIADYQHAKRSLENFYAHDTLLFHSERRNLALLLNDVQLKIKKNIGDKNNQKNIEKQSLQQAEAHLKESNRRWEVGQKLFASKTISEMELKDLEQQKIKAQTQFEVSQSAYKIELDQLSHDLESLEISEKSILEKLSKIRLEEQKQTAQLQTNFENVEQKIRLHYGDFAIQGENLVLLSQLTGQVAYLLETEKEVSQTAILLKITKNFSQIYAAASVAPHKVSYIKKEQEAYLKVSTFPHYEWGMLEGHVQTISTSPDANGMYPFQIRLDNKGKIGDLLQAGMTGHLSVVVEEKTVFGLVFRKFNVWKDEKVHGIKLSN